MFYVLCLEVMHMQLYSPNYLNLNPSIVRYVPDDYSFYILIFFVKKTYPKPGEVVYKTWTNSDEKCKNAAKSCLLGGPKLDLGHNSLTQYIRNV